jgi:FkbM family methyltransferase
LQHYPTYCSASQSMIDVLGNCLRKTSRFRGKWRLQRLWERCLPAGERRIASLPNGSMLNVELDIPYERMVWLQLEEWDELVYLQNKLSPGETFIDVGANIGLWTLTAASTVGTSGRVFSFEPNPKTYAKLTANLERNAVTAIVEAYQYAVTGNDCCVMLACEAAHNVSAITDTQSPNTVRVGAVSLDSLLGDRPTNVNVAGIKLDTEGHEIAALEGALRTLQTNWPWLIVEFNTTLLPSRSLKDWSVYRFLSSLGYKPFVHSAPFQEEPLDGEYIVDGYRNILFQQ